MAENTRGVRKGAGRRSATHLGLCFGVGGLCLLGRVIVLRNVVVGEGPGLDLSQEK